MRTNLGDMIKLKCVINMVIMAEIVIYIPFWDAFHVENNIARMLPNNYENINYYGADRQVTHRLGNLVA